ncbi:MAG: hypothetical protein ACI9K5_001165, partial [Gammaproteobacteria bacterium]
MDALALLCTLYAEGPSTLQRLHGGGCGSLAALLELEPEGLKECLGWNDRVAERFLREAWILAERLDAGWAEEELPAEQERPSVALVPEASRPRGRGTVPVDQTQREQLLERWRALDSATPPAEIALEADSRAVSYVVPERITEVPVRASTEPQSDPRLAELGLDPGHVARLESVGITTLDSFARRDGFELAQLLQVPFTRLQRLQLVARRMSPVAEAIPVDELVTLPFAEPVRDAAQRRAVVDPDRSRLHS